MADFQLVNALLGLSHVNVVSYALLSAERIEVGVESSLDAALCATCQRVSTQVHDMAELQTLRDLPIWGRQCWLRYAFGGRGVLPAPPATARLSNALPGANPALRIQYVMPSTFTNARDSRISPRLHTTKV
jgi:hypothetical protein